MHWFLDINNRGKTLYLYFDFVTMMTVRDIVRLIQVHKDNTDKHKLLVISSLAMFVTWRCYFEYSDWQNYLNTSTIRTICEHCEKTWNVQSVIYPICTIFCSPFMIEVKSDFGHDLATRLLNFLGVFCKLQDPPHDFVGIKGRGIENSSVLGRFQRRMGAAHILLVPGAYVL